MTRTTLTTRTTGRRAVAVRATLVASAAALAIALPAGAASAKPMPLDYEPAGPATYTTSATAEQVQADDVHVFATATAVDQASCRQDELGTIEGLRDGGVRAQVLHNIRYMLDEACAGETG